MTERSLQPNKHDYSPYKLETMLPYLTDLHIATMVSFGALWFIQGHAPAYTLENVDQHVRRDQQNEARVALLIWEVAQELRKSIDVYDAEVGTGEQGVAEERIHELVDQAVAACFDEMVNLLQTGVSQAFARQVVIQAIQKTFLSKANALQPRIVSALAQKHQDLDTMSLDEPPRLRRES